MGMLNKTATNPTQPSRYLYQDSNTEPPEYNSQALLLASAWLATVKFVGLVCKGHAKEFWLLSLLST
jgi:hypothetical protein